MPPEAPRTATLPDVARQCAARSPRLVRLLAWTAPAAAGRRGGCDPPTTPPRHIVATLLMLLDCYATRVCTAAEPSQIAHATVTTTSHTPPAISVPKIFVLFVFSKLRVS